MSIESGQVIWFSGSNGPEKSALSHAVATELRRRGRPVETLDGDTSVDPAEDLRHNACAARQASLRGTTVLIAAALPTRALSDTVRSILPEMLEVFVDASPTDRESRDIPGASAHRGPASAPDVICRAGHETVETSSSRVLKSLLIPEDQDAPPPATSGGRRLTIAVDFDGVIAEYDGWKGRAVLGTPRSDVLSALSLLRNEGWKIVIHTTRAAKDIRAYLVRFRVPFDEINGNSDYANGSDKPVATVYWDDRAVCYSGNAEHDLTKIRGFRTWSGRT